MVRTADIGWLHRMATGMSSIINDTCPWLLESQAEWHSLNGSSLAMYGQQGCNCGHSYEWWIRPLLWFSVTSVLSWWKQMLALWSSRIVYLLPLGSVNKVLSVLLKCENYANSVSGMSICKTWHCVSNAMRFPIFYWLFSWLTDRSEITQTLRYQTRIML